MLLLAAIRKRQVLRLDQTVGEGLPSNVPESEFRRAGVELWYSFRFFWPSDTDDVCGR